MYKNYKLKSQLNDSFPPYWGEYYTLHTSETEKKCRLGTCFYPSVVDWIEADLNESLQSCIQNDWREHWAMPQLSWLEIMR